MTSDMQERERKHILCVVHSQFNDLGRFRHLLPCAGWSVDRVNLLTGEVLSRQLHEYDAVMVFGGTGSLVSGLTTEMRKEYDLIETAISLNLPIVGICLGGQILSQIYGAPRPVERQPKPEIGFYSIVSAQDAPEGFWSHNVFFQWHWDTMPCPYDGRNLGATLDFDCQAFCVGNSLAVQFHPDATPQTVETWTEIGAGTLTNFSSKSRFEHIHDAFTQEANVERWSEEVIGSWLNGGSFRIDGT